MSVSGLVNGQTLGGFSLDSAHLVSASKVTAITLNGGIDARNYVLNGSAYGNATATPGNATDGSQATNGVSLSAAPLGVTIGGTYSGSTSIVPTSFSTHGLLGGDTITQRPAIVWVHGGGFKNGDKSSPEIVEQANVFAKKGYVSHVQLEHSSIVRFLQYNFIGKVGQLGYNDAKVANIGSLLDETAVGFPVPAN